MLYFHLYFDPFSSQIDPNWQKMQKSASESAFVTFAPDFKLDVIKTIFKVLNIDTSCPSKPLKVLMFFSYRKVSHVSQKICEHCSLFAGLLHALVVSCLFVCLVDESF